MNGEDDENIFNATAVSVLLQDGKTLQDILYILRGIIY